METEISIINEYIKNLKQILSRYTHNHNSYDIDPNDEQPLKKIILELEDYLTNVLNEPDYSNKITYEYDDGLRGFVESSSYASIENITTILEALITKLKRSPKKNTPTQTINENNKDVSKQIFISHSVKDKKLAKELVNLFDTGINGFNSNEMIFCSSLEGLAIPSGENFIQFIKEKLKGSSILIPLITNNYFESFFCVTELGAAWMKNSVIHPIIVPPINKEDVGGVLANIQSNFINKDSDLDNLMTEIVKDLQLPQLNVAKWNSSKKDFIKKVNDIKEKENELIQKRNNEQLSEHNYIGIEWDGNYIIYSSPQIEGIPLSNEKAIFQDSMERALWDKKFKTYRAIEEKLSNHYNKGYKKAYLTDNKNWKKEIVWSTHTLIIKPTYEKQ